MTRISTQAFYDRFDRDLTALRSRADTLQSALGSGERLTRPSDDPVAAARLRALARAEASAGIDQTLAARTATDLTLADKALQSFADQVIRVRELAIHAGSTILSATERGAIAAELDEIGKTLLGLANSRDSAGHALFGGQTSGAAYARDAAGVVSYLGTASAGDLVLDDGESIGRGITGPDFLDLATASGPTTLFAVVRTLADALVGPGDSALTARDSLGPLDTALDRLTTQQAVVGARLGWIDLHAERGTRQAELRAEEQAAVGGIDLAETVSKLQQTMTVLDATQASFARLSALGLFQYLR